MKGRKVHAFVLVENEGGNYRINVRAESSFRTTSNYKIEILQMQIMKALLSKL